MSLNSIFFIFLFLPISLILYYITPKSFRSIPLLVFSLVFYAWGTPEYLILILFSVLFNYITGIEIDEFLDRERWTASTVTLVIGIIVNLLILGFYKYYGFIVSNINAVSGLGLKAPDLPLPLGLSFYTFTVLSYIIDVYNDRTAPQKNLLDFAIYVTFFPKIVSGPIVQYADMEKQLKEQAITPAKFGAGINMFIVGLAKKVIIADNLGSIFSAISGLDTMSVVTAWLGMILYSLQLYYDFSGYSDMAIGISKLFGFDIEKNFDHPYLSSSISEFWRRWHISLGSWFRQYVYISLGGNRCVKWKQIRNLLVVWLLTGLWHGSSWNFIVWGLYHGAFVLLEKFILKDLLPKIPKPIRIFGTVLVAFFGWVLFFSPSLSSALNYFGQMFGTGHSGFLDSTAKYYFKNAFVLLVMAFIGCGGLVQRIHQNLAYHKGGRITYVSIVCYIVLLVISVAYLLSATYTSFLYVQF